MVPICTLSTFYSHCVSSSDVADHLGMGYFTCNSKSSAAVCKSSTEIAPVITLKDANLQVFKFKDLEAATGGFAKENLLARASHGHIYKGTLKDGRVVAVKRPSLGARLYDDEDALENEMQILSKLFSRRLVNLLGYSQDGKVKLLVVEHMVNGSLHERIHGQENNKESAETMCLSWPMRVQLALQIAKAIRALHASSPPIVHRNIKSMNVFIDRNWNARLGDFGLARCCVPAEDFILEPPRKSSNLSSIPEIETEELGGARYQYSSIGTYTVEEKLDLECEVNNSLLSSKTDVFSFGMLLLEIMSGRSAVALDEDFTPFSLLDWALPLIKNGNAMAVCDTRIKPPQHPAAVKHMAAIAARCVRSSSSRRPSMDEIVQSLTNVSRLVPLPIWTGFTSKVKSSSTATFPPATSSSGHEGLLQACEDPSLCKANKLIRLPLWTGFVRLKKKRRAFVFRLSRFLARKFRFTSVRYTKLPVNTIRRQSSKGVSKVSDEDEERGAKKPAIVDHFVHLKEEKKKATSGPPTAQPRFCKPGFWNQSSGKYFARMRLGVFEDEQQQPPPPPAMRDL